MRRQELDRQLAALASLGDPLRRDLYRCVTARDGGSRSPPGSAPPADRGPRAARCRRLGALTAGDRGYEPHEEDGAVRLRNCPFGPLAEAHRELVCAANLAFVQGLLQDHRNSGLRAVLQPRPGRCCVALV